MGDAFVLREAGDRDVEAIVECLAEPFAPFERMYTPGAFRDTVPTVEGIRQRMKTMQLFVACDSVGSAVGTIGCEVVQDGVGHLRGMAVKAEWQGLGVAQALLERAESELRARGCARCLLDTTEPLVRAMRFYERNGYRRSGKVTDFYGMGLMEYEKAL